MIKKTVLKNGLRVLLYPMANAKAATVLILVGSGANDETQKINGISHFLEHLIFKGTKKRPSTLSITKELDAIGAVYNAFTDKEQTGFWIKFPASQLSLALETISDILFNSLCKAKEIAKEKKVVFEEINMNNDIPQSKVHDLWEELLYREQAVGRPILGDTETLSRISRKEIINYRNSHFIAKNMVVSLAGGFKEKEALNKVNNFFKAVSQKQPLAKAVIKDSQSVPEIGLRFQKTNQSHLLTGVRTFGRFHPDHYVLAFISAILGGGISGRLATEVREKRGLAYYVACYPVFFRDSGYLTTAAGVDNDRIKDAITVILKEYRRLKSEAVPFSEFKRVREMMKGRILLSVETSDDWARYLGGQEISGQEILSPKQICDKLNKVTRNDIKRVANTIFRPEKLNLALIGPFKDKNHFQDILKV